MDAMIKNLVDDFQGLSLEDQEYVAEIIKKQLIEFRREYLEARFWAVSDKGIRNKGKL